MTTSITPRRIIAASALTSLVSVRKRRGSRRFVASGRSPPHTLRPRRSALMRPASLACSPSNGARLPPHVVQRGAQNVVLGREERGQRHLQLTVQRQCRCKPNFLPPLLSARLPAVRAVLANTNLFVTVAA